MNGMLCSGWGGKGANRVKLNDILDYSTSGYFFEGRGIVYGEDASKRKCNFFQLLNKKCTSGTVTRFFFFLLLLSRN